MSKYRFSLKKGDLEICISSTDKEFVTNELNYWKNIIQNNNDINLLEKTPKIKVRKNISLKDFFELKKPPTLLDKIIVTAYFLEKYEKMNNFSCNDITNILNEIDTITNEEVQEYMNKNVEYGYMIIEDENIHNTRYSISFLGEQYVKQGF